MRSHSTTLWRHPDFLKLWTGDTISLLGSQITLLALPLTAALILHASAFQVGLLGAMDYAPNLLLGLLIGVWADRHRRRPLLIGANLGRMALLGSIPLTALLGVLRMEQLYIVAVLTGALTTLFGVAYRPFLPTLVRPDQLVDSNSKLEISRSLAQISGPGLGGIMVQLVSAPLAIGLDALSFLLSTLFLAAIRTPEPPPHSPSRHQGVRAEIVEGLRFILEQPILRVIAGTTCLVFSVGALSLAVYVLYLTRDLRLPPSVQGGLFAVAGIGALVGALFLERLTRRFGIGPTIIGAEGLLGVSAFLVPLAGLRTEVALPLLVAAQFLQGLANTVYNAAWISLFQASLPRHMQGRVNATMGVLIFSLQPLGALLGGALGTVLGLQPTLLVAAIGWSLVFLLPLCSPLRQLRALPAGEA